VADMLDLSKTPAKPIYEMASEVPLVLYDCGYDGVEWQEDDEAIKRLITHYEEMSRDMALKSAVTGLMLSGVKGHLRLTSTAAPTGKSVTYVPLLKRPRNSSLEEKLARLSEKKRKISEEDADDEEGNEDNEANEGNEANE